ncbi:MAG: PrsW family glutamic-type intramembrane protease [Treponema sp.]|nr:PrsW family glutamic-type intramembrane protease [Treponema sp.]
MSGAWVLILLILLSSLPALVVFLWFKLAKYQFTTAWFLFALLTGAAAFVPALFLQNVLDFSFFHNRAGVFYEHFVRIAFSEELSRLLMLLVFFRINAFFSHSRNSAGEQLSSVNVVKKATAAGLVAGLGFALLENATLAASDINVLPLRIVLATAIHGACGARMGAAAAMLHSNKGKAILRIFSAIAIHGVYNLLVDIPGFSQIAAILIAVSALSTAILSIFGGWSGDQMKEAMPARKLS